MTDQVLSQTHETQVQELSPAQLEQVAGGAGANFLLADGSVRFDATGDGRVDAADYVLWRKNFGTGH